MLGFESCIVYDNLLPKAIRVYHDRLLFISPCQTHLHQLNTCCSTDLLVQRIAPSVSHSLPASTGWHCHCPNVDTLHPRSCILRLCLPTGKDSHRFVASHVQIQKRGTRQAPLVIGHTLGLATPGMKMHRHGRTGRCWLLFAAAVLAAKCRSATAQPAAPSSELNTPSSPPPSLELDTRAGSERNASSMRTFLFCPSRFSPVVSGRRERSWPLLLKVSVSIAPPHPRFENNCM